MAHWWVHLSFSHGGVVLGLIVIAVAILGTALLAPRDEKDAWKPQATLWPVVDYTEQYQRQSEWLGDRHLLAEPVKRLNIKTNRTVRGIV